jgi:signal transduction histidine kinase
MSQQTDLPQPGWLRPTLIGAVLVELVLSLLIDARLSPDEHAPWQARLVAVLLLGLTWLLELAGARLPRPLLVLVVALPVAWLNVVREGTASLLFLILAVAWATYTSTGRTSLVVLGIGLLACLSYLVVTDPEGWLSTSVGLVVTWFAVRGLVRQHQLLVEQQRLLSQLRAAQADLARAARSAERRRIAREIHDVAAHTLAVTMLQLTGVRLLLQRSGADPRAVEALGEAERLGRQGLDDVRRTVGLLADGEPEAVKGNPRVAEVYMGLETPPC